MCNNGSAIYCENVTGLKVKNLIFICSNSIISNANTSILSIIRSELIQISHVIFQGNAKCTDITTARSILNITSCFFNSSRGDSGGAIRASDVSNIAIAGTSFIDNTAMSSGGAIFTHCSFIALNGSLKNEFTHNTASSYGGAIHCKHCIINMTGSNTFENNVAESYDGGAIAVESNGRVFTSGTLHFSNNTAYNGGGIYLSNSTASFGGRNITLSGNSANVGGAMYCIETSQITTSTAHLYCTNNTVTESGGAIYVSKSSITLGNKLSSYHSFSNNTAHDYGGAISCESCSITIYGTNNFSNNRMLSFNMIFSHGGAISIRRGNITLSGNALLSKNEAYKGGAMYLETSRASLSGEKIEFQQNTAHYGGGIFKLASQLDTKDINFAGNTAHSTGGAVHITDVNMHGHGKTILLS